MGFGGPGHWPLPRWLSNGVMSMVSRPSNRRGGQISGHSLLFGLVGRKWWGASFWPLQRLRWAFSDKR